MTTQIQYSLAGTLLLAIVLVCAAQPVSSQDSSNEGPIIVEIHRTQGQLVLTLKPDPTPGKDILWGLATLVQQRGESYPVVALVDDDAKISDIDQASGIAAKAGFSNIRTFIVRRSLGRMFEIRRCPALPISTRPPLESTCESTR